MYLIYLKLMSVLSLRSSMELLVTPTGILVLCSALPQDIVKHPFVSSKNSLFFFVLFFYCNVIQLSNSFSTDGEFYIE